MGGAPNWLLDLLRIERRHQPAPPPLEPRTSANATKRPRKRAPVVERGDTAEEVRRKLGPPDRIEPGPLAGQAFFHYGGLRLELRHGRLADGVY